MTKQPRLTFAGMALAVAGSLAACGGSTSSMAATPSAIAPAATASPALNTPAAPTAAPTTSGIAFETRYFSPALDVTLPSFVKAVPDEETGHFVTFLADDGSRAIRILSPVSVFPPGSTKATAVPRDYRAYLGTLAAAGAEITDRADTTVDRHPATVMTAWSHQAFDGSIGCQAQGLDAPSCFGVGDEVILRLALIDTDNGPLLIWLRLRAADHPDMSAEAATFATFLEGVRFANRQPQPEPTAADTHLDGAYTWKITLDDAKAAHQVIAPQDVASYPWTFKMTLSNGVVKVQVGFAVGSPEAGTGTYEASADRLTLHFGGIAQVYGVKRDQSGNLRLTAIDVKDPGDVFVNTVKPWTKVP